MPGRTPANSPARSTVAPRNREGNRDFKNARFCRARAVPGCRAIVHSPQGLETRLGGHRTSTGRGGPVAGHARRAHVRSMRLPLSAPALLSLVLIGASGVALAQHLPNVPIGTSPAQLAPPAPPAPTPGPPPGGTAAGARYPNTESLARDRVQSQGYKVQRLEQRNDGSWKADATRDPVPTRPRGVPTKVTILPDGRMLEEYD